MNHQKPRYWVASLFAGVLVALFFISAVGARDVSLYFAPDKGNFEVGEIFSVRLEINALKKVNVVASSVHFPPEILDVVSISSEESILKLWVTEVNFSNRKGVVEFEGGLFNGGFSGKGNIIDIRFMAKAEGEAIVTAQNSTVLAHDGLGTVLDVESGRAEYVIRTPAPVSSFPIFGSPRIPIFSQDRLRGDINPYDINEDGRVDIFDVIYFMRYWVGPYDSRLDFDNNGRIGMSDLSILLSNVFE